MSRFCIRRLIFLRLRFLTRIFIGCTLIYIHLLILYMSRFS